MVWSCRSNGSTTGVGVGFSIRSLASAQSVGARGGTVGSAPVGWVGSSISLLTPTYEKLNIFRSIWAERKVILDELDPEIHRNFERRGWLPLLEVEHPLLDALIREFYLNLSIHSNDSNTQYVRSWIKGEEYVITPSVVASRVSDLLNNLKCPTMSNYRWYQDVFLSRVMHRKDCFKPYWKEKFIDGLPLIFAHKVK